MSEGQSSRRTPLYECHREAGARMVDFAGWEMPVQYAGVIDEHRAVRTAAGLFDVSHMGEVRVRGAGAEAFLQRLTPNDVAKLVPGRAHYSGLLTERGTYVDDILVYRLAAEDFLVVVNASNARRDFAWIATRAAGECRRRGGGRERPLRPAGAPGAAGARRSWRRSPRRTISGAQVLRLRAGDGRRRAGADLADRLHGGGRLRALPGAGGRAEGLAAAARRRRPARRPRRARHPPPRGGDGALRPRDRRDDDPVRGGPELGGEARQGGLPRTRRPARPEGRGEPAPAGGLRGAGPGNRAPGARRCLGRARGWAR